MDRGVRSIFAPPFTDCTAKSTFPSLNCVGLLPTNPIPFMWGIETTTERQEHDQLPSHADVSQDIGAAKEGRRVSLSLYIYIYIWFCSIYAVGCIIFSFSCSAYVVFYILSRFLSSNEHRDLG